MCTPHRSFILFFENVYLTLNILFYKPLYTERLQWPFYFDIYLYIRNIYNCLFMSFFLFSFTHIPCMFVCILLECCTYCIYWTLWSVTSSYCKWELMFYCFTVPTWNKDFLLLLLLLLLLLHWSKKISKIRVTGPCVGISPVTGEFPAQTASNEENVSIWWRHHGRFLKYSGDMVVLLGTYCTHFRYMTVY